MNSKTQVMIEGFLTHIDLGLALDMALKKARTVANDFISSLFYASMFSFLTICCLYMAYMFDFLSTYDFMMKIVDPTTADLPSNWNWLAPWLGVIFTLLPTVVEVVTVSFARGSEPILILKYLILALLFIDVVTDIPKTVEFTQRAWVTMELGALPIIGHIVSAVIFFMWLFLATVGFEILTIIFAFLTIIYVLKAFGFHSAAQNLAAKPNIR